MGGMDLVKEQYRDRRGIPMLASLYASDESDVHVTTCVLGSDVSIIVDTRPSSSHAYRSKT